MGFVGEEGRLVAVVVGIGGAVVAVRSVKPVEEAVVGRRLVDSAGDGWLEAWL